MNGENVKWKVDGWVAVIAVVLKARALKSYLCFSLPCPWLPSFLMPFKALLPMIPQPGATAKECIVPKMV